ncbi:hypothetical protein ABZW11_35070 [Nonomuraea sp. NPDC004580]|uniref:nSTAND1 domain-containing NTPase n=1 Tax=Nonomuraea sp. NPDC004580 TaxID=3154552 RepID=UPI0033A28107
MSDELPDDPSGLLRGGTARSVRTARSRVRTWTPAVLLAVLSSGAFAALLTGAGPVAAGIGAFAAVGGNLLTDLVKSGIDALKGRDLREEEVRTELERRISAALEGGGEHARALRAEIAAVLRTFELAGAAIEEAVRTGDRELQAALTDGLARLGGEFAEFSFVLSDVEGRLRRITEGVDQSRAQLQVAVGLQYRQATDTRLLLEQVSLIERRTRGSAAAVTGPRWSDGSPYKGLSGYGEADADVFSGREVVTAELVSTLSERLGGTGLLVLTGASGAGKSSLLRAGLLPAIARGDLSEAARHWPRHVLDRPGREPLTVLATLLAGLAGLDAGTVLAALRRAPGEASLLVRQAVDTDARRRAAPGTPGQDGRLILVVDQFEEVFDAPEGERAAFVAALHAAATVPSGPAGAPAALVVIAVRGDVIDRCADHPDLVDALQEGPFVLGAMNEQELRAAITVPAAAAGLRLEAGLADTVLADLRSSSGGFDAGVLPLLSQAMLTVWEHREDDLLTHRGYARTGGVTHAVTASAEAAYDGLDPAGRERARQVFQQLAAVSAESRLVRRARPRAELGPVDDVLEVFARRRLLVADTGSVQIAHEALLQHWPRLRGWMEADLTGHALRSQLLDEAEEWRRNRRDASYLYRGERLDAVLHARPRWEPGTVTGPAAEFLEESVRARSLSRRRRRLTVVALSALLAVAVAFGGVALVQGSAAREQAAAASEQQRVATARRLIAKAESALSTDPRTALMLGVAAHRIHPDAETYAALQNVLTTTPYAGQLAGVRQPVTSIAYAPSGRYLAAGFSTGAIMLWDVRDPLRPRQTGAAFKGFESPATVRFTRDERRLVTIGSEAQVVIWDLADPARPAVAGRRTTYEKGDTAEGWLSPDGSVLATSSDKQPRLQLWDVRDPARIKRAGRPFPAVAGPVRALAFSPDGTTMAMAAYERKAPALLWDVRERTAPRPLAQIVVKPDDIVESLAFSADGRMLAVGGSLRGTHLWDVGRPARPRPLSGPLSTSILADVLFSPGDDLLATTGSRDSGLLVWDTSDPSAPQLIERLTAGQMDRAIAFSPDGRVLAAGSSEGRVTLWNLGRAGRPRAFGPPAVGHQDGEYTEIYAMDLSDDGTMVATGGRDSAVELWDATDQANPHHVGTLTGHTGEGVNAVAFTTDGRTLATGDGKGTVLLWDLTDRRRPRRWGPPLSGPTGIVRSLVFAADAGTLTVGGDDSTMVWDVRDPARPRFIGHVLSGERTLGTWRVRDGRVLALVIGSGTYATPTAVAEPLLTPTSGGDSPEVRPPEDGPGDPTGARLWDITDIRHPSRLGPGLVGHEAEVSTAALSPAADLLVTSDRNGAVILWDLSDPARARPLGDPLVPHGTLQAVAVAFAPVPGIMVTGGIDGNAYLWDLGNRILPRQLSTALADNLDTVWPMAFSADGDILATAGYRGDFVLWDLRPTYELRRHLDETACLVTGGGLDRERWPRYLPDLPYRDTCG